MSSNSFLLAKLACCVVPFNSTNPWLSIICSFLSKLHSTQGICGPHSRTDALPVPSPVLHFISSLLFRFCFPLPSTTTRFSFLPYWYPFWFIRHQTHKCFQPLNVVAQLGPIIVGNPTASPKLGRWSSKGSNSQVSKFPSISSYSDSFLSI